MIDWAVTMMSKKEGFLILDSSQNAASRTAVPDTAVEKPRQNVVRKTLADISNLPNGPRMLIQEGKSQSVSNTTKEYIDQLQKENIALVKMLTQRNKIVEQSGIELERLRVNLLKMQEQNQQLALSNTQMLTELNSSKDRLKTLHHELGCKNALLKDRKLEPVEKTSTGPLSDSELANFGEEGEPSKEGLGDGKTRKAKTMSLQANTSEELQSKGRTESKRPVTRRQSARFKAADTNPSDKHEPSDVPVRRDNGSTSEDASVKIEDNECNSNSSMKHESQESSRPSICRPSRVAAKKVQSYKEIPINVKMRRLA